MRFSKTGLGRDSSCSSLSQPDSQVGGVHLPAAPSLPAAYLVMEYNPGLFPPVSSNRFPRRSPVVAQSSRTRSECFSFIYLLTGCSGSWCCTRAFSGGGEQGYSPLWSAGSGLRELRYAGSAVVAHGLSYPSACGIFLDQGLNSQFPELADGFSTTGPPG